MGELANERLVRRWPYLLIALECLLWFVAAGGCLIVSGQDFIPPEVSMVNSLSCEVTQITKGTQKGKWLTTAVAKYQNHDTYQREPWTKPLGIDSDQVKGTKRCKRWMDAVIKVQRNILPVQIKNKEKS